MEAYLEFKYDSHFTTLEDNFNKLAWNSSKWRGWQNSIKFSCRIGGRRYYKGGCGWTDYNTSWRVGLSKSSNGTRNS
jgi:hypothetical protein